MLRSLVGASCQFMVESPEFMLSSMDAMGRTRTMRILDADENRIRVEYERSSGIGKKETVVQLIDVNVVSSITVVGEDS